MTAILPLLTGMAAPAEPVTGKAASAGIIFDDLLAPTQPQITGIKLRNPNVAAGFDAGLFLSALARAPQPPAQGQGRVGVRPDMSLPTETSTRVEMVDSLPSSPAPIIAMPAAALPLVPVAIGVSSVTGSAGSNPNQPITPPVAPMGSRQQPLTQPACIVPASGASSPPTEFPEPVDTVNDHAPTPTRAAAQAALWQGQGQVVVVESENGLVISCADLGEVDIPIGHLQDIASRVSAEFAITSATLAYRNNRVAIAIRQSGGTNGHGSRQ